MKDFPTTFKDVLILGSAPDALRARDWASHPFDAIVAINNAWRVRDDWTHTIFPSDFPAERRATPVSGQSLISASDYVKVQNQFGGFVYAGGTMSFTAAYWALGALNPSSISFLGCDMIYDAQQTHFYGTGQPDPLRDDITLRSLEAKSARFEVLASHNNVSVVNLSNQPQSRMVFARAGLDQIETLSPQPKRFASELVDQALQAEKSLGYFVPDGRYWKQFNDFDYQKIDEIDALWLASIRPATA